MKLHYDLVTASIAGYDSDAVGELKRILEADGFVYQGAQKGGGGPSPIEHVIAYLDLKDLPKDIVVGMLVDQILLKLRKWFRKHQGKSAIDGKPIVVVFLYLPGEDDIASCRLDLQVDRSYTKEQMRAEVEKAEKERKW